MTLTHTKPLNAAVIGTGYLGRFHAQKYAAAVDVDLKYVVDLDLAAATAVAEETGAIATSDYQSILGEVDLVSIVVPTTLHYVVAKQCLMAGVHCLVEKPITVTEAEADELIAIAKQRNLCLQVGHLEQFNPVVRALALTEAPRFIEAYRLAPFNPRANDVSVVLDLMIHDIEIVQSLVNSPLIQVDASGASVITNGIDIANARLKFANQSVANLTASRISQKSERKMRLFGQNHYYSLDFQDRKLSHHWVDGGASEAQGPSIDSNSTQFEQADALKQEILDFIECVRRGRPPIVSGEQGRDALSIALKIMQQIEDPS